MAKRNDPHRPSRLIPADYEHVLSYNGATSCDGFPIPSHGINCELDGRHWVDSGGNLVPAQNEGAKLVNGTHRADGQCCVTGLLRVAEVKMVGNACQCTVCGTRFVYGEVWHHVKTGEHIHVGHICGKKFGLLADRSEFELQAGRAKQAVLTALKREANAEKRAAFLAKHPGLAEALDTDHHIVQDIKLRFTRTCELSDKQVALVLKLAAEATAPVVCDYCDGAHDESDCPQRKPIPAGRQDLRLRILGTKWQESPYGGSLKMLTRDLGTGSKVWLTVPNRLTNVHQGEIKGLEVDIRATIQPSDRDRFFAFGSRPHWLSGA